MNSPELTTNEHRRLARDVFLLAISVLAIFNSVNIYLPILVGLDDDVLYIMNGVLGLLFFLDFLIRFLTAESRRHYFFRQAGWADLLSGVPIPAFQFLRILPSWRTVRTLRTFGGRTTLRDLVSNRAGGALFLAVFLSLLLIEVASMSIVSIEAASPEANIKTAGDAVWWAYVTVTTIGYGDRYPVTGMGRFIGALLMTVGVGLFSVLTGYLANAFLGRPLSRTPEPAKGGMALPSEEAIDASLASDEDLEQLLREHEALVAKLRRHLERHETDTQQMGHDN